MTTYGTDKNPFDASASSRQDGSSQQSPEGDQASTSPSSRQPQRSDDKPVAPIHFLADLAVYATNEGNYMSSLQISMLNIDERAIETAKPFKDSETLHIEDLRVQEQLAKLINKYGKPIPDYDAPDVVDSPSTEGTPDPARATPSPPEHPLLELLSWSDMKDMKNADQMEGFKKAAQLANERFTALLNSKLEAAERAYFDSVLKRKAIASPDMTIKEWYDRLCAKQTYTAQQGDQS